MKRLTLAVAGLLLALTALGSAHAAATPAPAAAPLSGAGGAHGFDRFLRRYEAANTAFVNGDPSLWVAITADEDPVSIFGGFGGLGDAGLANVDKRYQLAATAFLPSGAKVDFEYLVKDVRGRLAYTVAIERSNVAVCRARGAAATGVASHDDLPLRQGWMEHRPPPRRHDGRAATPEGLNGWRRTTVGAHRWAGGTFAVGAERRRCAMKVGVLLVFQNWHQDLTDEEMFRSEIRLGEMAETLGYDSVWSVEHHFDDYSMCPDATQALSYLAGRTSSITLGTGAVILPWNDPLRVAEKITLLDHLAEGRVGVRDGQGPGEDGVHRLPAGHERGSGALRRGRAR